MCTYQVHTTEITPTALDESAGSDLLDALTTGAGTDLVRELAQWALQQLIEAGATAKIGAGCGNGLSCLKCGWVVGPSPGAPCAFYLRVVRRLEAKAGQGAIEEHMAAGVRVGPNRG